MKRKIFFVAAVLFFSTLHAQNDSTANLEEITITATRFSKKINETGKVVSIITQEELSKQGGKDLSQILSAQPGIIINGSGSNPGKDKAVYLRGAGYGYTLILLNGVPVVDPSGIGGAFDLRMIPVEQIERIEILKGAQSTLYGSEAVAGVINIITKTGNTKPANLSGSFSYGSNKTIRTNAALGGSFNGSSYNIGFVHMESAGISEAKDTLKKNGIKNGLLNNAVQIDINGKLSEKLYIKPYFRYSYYKGSVPDGAFAPNANPYNSVLLATGTQVVYNFTGGSINGLYAYDEVKRNYSFSYGIYNYAGSKKTLELYSNYNIGKYFQTLAGIRYDKLIMENPAPKIKDTSAIISSPYLSFFLKNFHHLNIEVGGRLNHHTKFGNNFTYSINPSYLLNEKIKLFLNYGTSFRAPSLSELYGQWGPNPDLKPETSKTFEAGISTDIAEKFKARAVYFSRDIKDVITYNSQYTYVNYNRQKDHGFELETSIPITQKLLATLFYNFTEGNVAAKNGTKDTTYNNLFRRPRHSFGAVVQYNITPSLFVSTNLHYFGDRQDLYFDSKTYSSRTIKLEPYTLWDVYAEYKFLKNKIKIFGQVTNILHADYYEVYGYSIMERQFFAGFKFNL